MLNFQAFANPSSKKDTFYIRRMITDFITQSLGQEKEIESKQFAFDLTKGHCFYCGEKLYRVNENKDNEVVLMKNATWDHVYPASNFGILTKGNEVLCCGKCNKAKDSFSAESYFLNLLEHGQLTYFDTFTEFKETLNLLREEYKKTFPLVADLNERIKNNEITDISLSEFLILASYNNNVDLSISFENPRVQDAIPFNPNAANLEKKQTVKKAKTIETVSPIKKQKMDEVIYEVVEMTKKAEGNKQSELKLLKSIVPLIDTDIDSIFSLSNQILKGVMCDLLNTNKISKRGYKSLVNFFSLASIRYKKSNLMMNKEFIHQLK